MGLCRPNASLHSGIYCLLYLIMRLVFTAAVMDILHEGHINLLEKMRESGDLVLVVLHDGFTTFKNKHKLPIESLEKRTRNLIDTGLVDIVRYTFEAEPIEAFKKILKDYNNFDLLFMRGDDWEKFPAKKTIEGKVDIKYIPYTTGISSSNKKEMLNSQIYKNPKVSNFRGKAHKDIRDIDEILKENNIEYFLSAGTMLGAVREGDFIEYDWDVDLCSMNYPKGIEQLKITSDFILKGFKAEFQASEESGRLKISRNVDTDIHFMGVEGKLAMCRIWEKPLYSILLKYIKLSKARLGNYEYNIISKKYLDSVYKDWKTPMKDNYFNEDYTYVQNPDSTDSN